MSYAVFLTLQMMSPIRKTVLITSGPTWVPIDDMRVISNRSSGELSCLLTDELIKKGFKVTLLEGPVLKPCVNKKANVIKFQFLDEFVKLFRKECSLSYDWVVHAAAVSDYYLKNPSKSKIKSDKKELKLTLQQAPKIIELIKTWAPQSKLVGFKLESHINKVLAQKLAQKQMSQAHSDIVITNTQNAQSYKAYIVRENQISKMIMSKKQLAKELAKQI